MIDVRVGNPTPAYWRELLGDDFFADAVLVRFHQEVALRSLDGLENLRDLEVRKTTDDGLAPLERVASLEILSLRGTGISDAGVAHLRYLKHLDFLDISDTHVTDAGLARFTG